MNIFSQISTPSGKYSNPSLLTLKAMGSVESKDLEQAQACCNCLPVDPDNVKKKKHVGRRLELAKIFRHQEALCAKLEFSRTRNLKVHPSG
jgi:reverse gyrase